MAYGSRNERVSEENQDGRQWKYSYDELLRLKKQTDPNGLIRTPTYDPAGRVLFVDFTSGRRDTFVYDDNDNPKLVSRRSSGVTTALELIYDPLDRVREQDDALNQTVLYGYDPLGRVTSITYPGNKTLTNNYDALGRLTNQIDWAGRQMNYSYDLTDRLLTRSYPNGVLQTNTFDSAGRITSLSYAPATITSNSVNIALSYAYDHNGNKTGGSEKGTLEWPLPSLSDESSGFSASGRITNRVDSLNATNKFIYQYDASGNMTNATGWQTTTLSYDEDNRVVALKWDSGFTEKVIANRYDALGRRIAKTDDLITTGYVLSLVGGMERVLCDIDRNGSITSWYVHGPDICYRVDASNTVTCYHADRQGNIIATSGGSGTNRAQYAYTPYGRSLGSTNWQQEIGQLSSNPFLFVGSQGVMEELSDLYFMRARYFSAETGVFLSTDPVRKVGPGWKPETYNYAGGNPLSYSDPQGKFIIGILTSIIVESISIDYDILVERQNLTIGDLGARYVKAAAEGAVSGEFGGELFNSPLGTIAKKGISYGVSFAGNALVGYAKGELDFNQVAAETFQDNFLSLGFDYFGKKTFGGILSKAEDAVLDVGKGTTEKLLTGGATRLGGLLGKSDSKANQTVRSAGIAQSANSGQSQSLAAPAKSSVSSVGGGGVLASLANTYTIHSGDTLGNIAYANHTTVAAIANLNGISNPDLIYAGQNISIPTTHLGGK